LEKVAADYEGRVLVTKVNTDENPEWAIKFGVQGIPTMLFINQGELKSRMVGASPAPVIIAKTEELLQTASIQTNS
jgi:thioredoxin 1